LAAFSELVIEQGASFSTFVNVEDTYGAAINLDSYSAQSQMRKSYYSATSYVITASVTGTANGEITLSMPAANTAGIRAT
jgi:hypothetical protein